MFKRKLTTKLYPCCISSCPAIFRLSPGNYHDAPEGDKTLVLAEDHGFKTVVPPKKKS